MLLKHKCVTHDHYISVYIAIMVYTHHKQIAITYFYYSSSSDSRALVWNPDGSQLTYCDGQRYSVISHISHILLLYIIVYRFVIYLHAMLRDNWTFRPHGWWHTHHLAHICYYGNHILFVMERLVNLIFIFFKEVTWLLSIFKRGKTVGKFGLRY